MCGSELHAGELNAGENTVETESLCAGTYIIMINSSDGQRTIKKVVKK